MAGVYDIQVDGVLRWERRWGGGVTDRGGKARNGY